MYREDISVKRITSIEYGRMACTVYGCICVDSIRDLCITAQVVNIQNGAQLLFTSHGIGSGRNSKG